MASRSAADRRARWLAEIVRLADVAIFGTLSETYRTCGHAGCRCLTQGAKHKHGPHLNVSYRGPDGKTTGYYVPKDAESAVRKGSAAWIRIQDLLRKLADINKQHALADARRNRGR